tara:strand:+ start:11668 stop:11925 length:258 start_codon:yes stop_codon:yes gene_type:complete
LEVIEQFIKKKDNRAPKSVKMKGIFFRIVGANSASKSTRFSKFVVTEVRKNGEPTPINKSLEKKPQKILPKARNISGKTISIGAS